MHFHSSEKIITELIRKAKEQFSQKELFFPTKNAQNNQYVEK